MRILFTLSLLLAGALAFATPSTLVWIPSTDIQPTGVWHLGADTYVFTAGNDSPAPAFDFGLTYGVTPRIEVGIDAFANLDDPLFANAKVLLLAPTDALPLALSAGIYNVGTTPATSQAIWYALGSYPVGGVRVTAGAYQGREAVLGNDNSGILLGLDKQISEKIWLGADYQSGDNAMGAWNLGIGYALSDNASILLGYDHYNEPGIVGAKSSLNFQFDVNL